MRDASRVRNLAAAAVLVVTGLGLIATSQAQLSVELPIAGGGAAQLTAETPVAVVPITVRASDEALWPSDPAISVSDAWIMIGWSGPRFSQTAGRAAESRLTLIPHDDPQAATEAVTTGSLDLLQLCPQDRDCELHYDLVLEWLEPVAGQTFSAGWRADGRVLLVGSEDLPLDASASVAVGKPDLRAIPILSDRVADDSIHLSVDRPIAVRHIVVSAPAHALPVPAEYPLEGRAVLTVRTVVEGQVSPYYGEQPVIVTLVPDPGTPAWNTSDVVYGSVQLNPFAGCAVGVDCVHGYTLRAEWVASEPPVTADVSWVLDARLLYYQGPAPAPDAAVSAEIDGAWNATPDAPALTAGHSGLLVPSPDRGGTAVTQRITFRLNAAAVPEDEPIAGGPPAVVTVTLRAVANRPLGEKPPTLLVSLSVPGGANPETLYPGVVIGGDDRRVTVFPLRGCEQGQPCEVTITLGTGFSANDVEALGDAGVRLQWQIDVRLPYLSRGAVPAGATLEILDEPDR